MARANPRSVSQRIFQSYPLVWVDPSIDESNSACQHTLQQLRTVANDITIFTDVDRCVAFLENVYNEKVIVITSEELGQNLVPCIHSMAQVHTIYIFCNNRVLHEAWTEGWSKIKGVCTRIEPICEVLQYLTGQHNEDSTLISFVPLDLTTFATNLDQLEPSFMYTQLFKSAFLEMEHDKNEHKDLVVYCREQKAGLSAELSVVDEFEHKYSPDKAIWWYTRECFIYPTLNRALRLLESDVIVEMGFFVHDLHQQIEQLHREQMEQYRGQSFELYRGQGLSTTDFDKLKHTLGGLLSFNNFLSTTRDRALAEARAESSSHATETFGIVFVMTIDSALASTPFASISEHSYFEDTEMEVLFSMHSVFRIDQVNDLNGNGRLFEVQLTLTPDDDPQLRLVREKMDEEVKGFTGWKRTGMLLIKVGQMTKAEELYNSLLSRGGSQIDSAHYNNQLGYIKDMIAVIIEVRYLTTKSALILCRKLFHPITPILPRRTTTLVRCIRTWESIPKPCRIMRSVFISERKLSRIITLIWPPHTTTLDRFIIAWKNIPRPCRITRSVFILDSKLFQPSILMSPAHTSTSDRCI